MQKPDTFTTSVRFKYNYHKLLKNNHLIPANGGQSHWLFHHELNEQLALIKQLDDDEKNALVRFINSMLTKKRMKDLLDGKIKLAV